MLICCDETATSEPLQGYIEDCIVTTKMHMAGTRHKCRKRQNSDFYWYGEAVVLQFYIAMVSYLPSCIHCQQCCLVYWSVLHLGGHPYLLFTVVYK